MNANGWTTGRQDGIGINLAIAQVFRGDATEPQIYVSYQLHL